MISNMRRIILMISVSMLLTMLAPNEIVAASKTAEKNSPSVVTNNQKAPTINLAFLNSYIPNFSKTPPEHLPFVSEIDLVFKRSSVGQFINPPQRYIIAEKIKNFCQSNKFNQDSIYNQLLAGMQEKGINVVVPRYKVNDRTDVKRNVYGDLKSWQDKRIVEPEMTLMEKSNFPILVLIKYYRTEISYEGQRSGPPILDIGEYSFHGNLLLKAHILIDIVNSSTNEVIDKIEFKKTYTSDPVDIVIVLGLLGPNPTSIKTDTTKDPLNKMLENYYMDLNQTVIGYNWQGALNFISKK